MINSWYELLKDEYNWNMLDADGVKWYVGRVINEAQFKLIVNGGATNETD